MNFSKVILLAFAVVVLLLVLGTIGRGREGFISGFGTSGAPPVASFILYYADWCPHCQTVKPDFKAFAQNGVVTVNGKNVAVSMVEESEKDKIKDKTIKGFPTFLFETAAGETVEYNGPRTKDAWMDFLAENVGK